MESANFDESPDEKRSSLGFQLEIAHASMRLLAFSRSTTGLVVDGLSMTAERQLESESQF